MTPTATLAQEETEMGETDVSQDEDGQEEDQDEELSRGRLTEDLGEVDGWLAEEKAAMKHRVQKNPGVNYSVAKSLLGGIKTRRDQAEIALKAGNLELADREIDAAWKFLERVAEQVKAAQDKAALAVASAPALKAEPKPAVEPTPAPAQPAEMQSAPAKEEVSPKAEATLPLPETGPAAKLEPVINEGKTEAATPEAVRSEENGAAPNKSAFELLSADLANLRRLAEVVVSAVVICEQRLAEIAGNTTINSLTVAAPVQPTAEPPLKAATQQPATPVTPSPEPVEKPAEDKAPAAPDQFEKVRRVAAHNLAQIDDVLRDCYPWLPRQCSVVTENGRYKVVLDREARGRGDGFNTVLATLHGFVVKDPETAANKSQQLVEALRDMAHRNCKRAEGIIADNQYMEGWFVADVRPGQSQVVGAQNHEGSRLTVREEIEHIRSELSTNLARALDRSRVVVMAVIYRVQEDARDEAKAKSESKEDTPKPKAKPLQPTPTPVNVTEIKVEAPAPVIEQAPSPQADAPTVPAADQTSTDGPASEPPVATSEATPTEAPAAPSARPRRERARSSIQRVCSTPGWRDQRMDCREDYWFSLIWPVFFSTPLSIK